MAKRIFEIAKELGVKSKAVIEKCRAEGIPDDKVKNHMASISPGLEASIREWFSVGAGAVATAVETAEHVDLEKVKLPARAKAKARSHTESETHPEESHDDAEAPGEDTQDKAPEPQPATPSPSAQTTPPTPAPASRNATPTPRAPEPAPEAPAPAPEVHDQPDADEASGERETIAAPAAEAPTRQGRQAPAPENVPSRPDVVRPAGRPLADRVKTPAKLSGPRVVRIEAPEPEVKRPRRAARPAAFDEPGAPMAPGTDDGGRSPRRNKRRGPGGPGGPGGPNQGPGGRGVPARRRAKTAGGDDLGTGMFREQDLLERQARLQRSGGFLKMRRQKLRSSGGAERALTAAETGGVVKIPAPFTIKDLSAATGVRSAEIVKKLFLQGVMATINSGIDAAQAQEIMADYDIELEVTELKTAEEAVSQAFENREAVDSRPRPPIVTILGHVDHGKTSLLDKIRHAEVAAGEAGGITQATSAFRVPVSVGGETKEIVFLDTPGHQAFTEMRSRGANMTDIVVLVVAADDGVMPQTVESIAHAKAAGVPIVVALNKIDKPEATDTKVQEIFGQLNSHELNPVEWGGDIEVVRTSATSGQGIDSLLEVLDIQGQILELTADFEGPARGTVVEARMEEGRGAVANVIVQDGRLKIGDFIVVGRGYGRVRDIVDDRGQRLQEVGPAHPVQISGFDELPDAGDKFYIVDSLRKAEKAATTRRDRERQKELAAPKVTLDTMFAQMAESDLKEIRVVVKADVQGSVDVLRKEIEQITTAEVRVRVLHTAVGGITESDVLLAQASNAVVIGFNVIPSSSARSVAEQKNVEIRSYQVIYDITDDLKKAAEGMLDPELRQEVLGHAEVRRVFKVSKVGSIAGCYCTDGSIERNALIRVTRDGIVIENDRVLEQLKRFKDDVKDVRNGQECGMKIVGYDDIKEGDVLECYRNIEVKRTL